MRRKREDEHATVSILILLNHTKEVLMHSQKPCFATHLIGVYDPCLCLTFTEMHIAETCSSHGG